MHLLICLQAFPVHYQKIAAIFLSALRTKPRYFYFILMLIQFTYQTTFIIIEWTKSTPSSLGTQPPTMSKQASLTGKPKLWPGSPTRNPKESFTASLLDHSWPFPGDIGTTESSPTSDYDATKSTLNSQFSA